MRESYEFDIPLHLTPHDFDWQQSRPAKPWPKHKYSLNGLTDYWRLDWIELRRADVEKILCGAQRRSKGLASTVKDETLAAKMLAPHHPPGSSAFGDLVAAGQPSINGAQAVPKSIRDLNALPSSTLRWLYNLMPEPTKFEIYGRERQLAKRILAERDRSTATARAPAPPLTTSALEAAVDLSNVVPQPAPITPGPTPAGTGTARRRRKGPAPGTVDRFGGSDRALFPEIECIMREGHKTVHAAALELASAGRVQGGGTPESLAKRLAKRFRKERRPSATR